MKFVTWVVLPTFLLPTTQCSHMFESRRREAAVVAVATAGSTTSNNHDYHDSNSVFLSTLRRFNQPWCMTVKTSHNNNDEEEEEEDEDEDIYLDAPIELEICNVTEKPAIQRWILDYSSSHDDGANQNSNNTVRTTTKIRSVLDATKCLGLMVSGGNVVHKAQAQLMDCDAAPWTNFEFDGFGQIVVANHPKHPPTCTRYCITTREMSGQHLTWIWAKVCESQARFAWVAMATLMDSPSPADEDDNDPVVPKDPHPPTVFRRPPTRFSTKQMIYASKVGYCLQPYRLHDTTVLLDECQEELAWTFEPISNNEDKKNEDEDNGNTDNGGARYLLHSALDPTKCLEWRYASWYGNDDDIPQAGDGMITAPCNSQDLSQLVWVANHGQSLHFAHAPEVCIVYSSPNRFSSIVAETECVYHGDDDDGDENANDEEGEEEGGGGRADDTIPKPWIMVPVKNEDNAVQTCSSNGDDDDMDDFLIDGDEQIGDPLWTFGGVVEECGPNCYLILDSGSDPGSGWQRGTHFAYKQVSGKAFSIQAKVCLAACIDSIDAKGSHQNLFGHAGLMIRNNLSLFDPQEEEVSNSIDRPTEDNDNTPDVTCEWVYLERKHDVFHRARGLVHDEKGPCQKIDWYWNGTVTSTDMPETVYVGLYVSSRRDDSNVCSYNAANFEHIQCRNC